MFYDVGANVGAYSLIAATAHKNVSVFSFEPSFSTYGTLVKNVLLNGLENQVHTYPIGLSNITEESRFNMSSMVSGAAEHSVGSAVNYLGKPFTPKAIFSVLAFEIDAFRTMFDLPCPEFLKIDVDGIEHLVLAGIGHLIRSTRSILIEVNKSFLTQSNSLNELLISQHFNLTSEFEILAENLEGQMFNQIWTKS